MSSLCEVENASASAAALPGDSPHHIHTLPILLLLPHNRCNCRCVMCDIWRIRQVREIRAEDLEPHRESLRALKVQWIVFSGGEPLMHSDLAELSQLCRGEGIRLTLLTAGLLLERKARMVAEHLDDVIVSLDGPPEIHDRIRGVPRAFERLARGIAALRRIRPDILVAARCTVQKGNHRSLRAIVRTAKYLQLNSISFLAADVTSAAFNRPAGWPSERQGSVALDAQETEELGREVEALLEECREAIATGFVAQNAESLRRIVRHFRAQLGQVEPVAPRCNAPWVSAVVEADGSLRPCFFHPALGNIHDAPLLEILNSPQMVEFRAHLDVATNPICRRCVCSLHLQPPDVSR
ncbi:MAG: radical SAM protein [Acidobacteriia bacterium]|nr:radical SAM protein [Terriglobia bacterium]